MDMYPYVETLKLGAAYAVLLYIWPCILFRDILRNKGLTFRFLFCTMVQPLLISTVVLSLGLLRILNMWIVRALFWGALAVSILEFCWEWQSQSDARIPLKALITRSYGWRMFLSRIGGALAQWWQKRRRNLWQRRGILVEYLILAAIIIFGMAFFLNGPFHHYSFGCNDEYIHYNWTSALLEGEIFTEGVYPEGMHCFLYALNVLFGVSLYNSIVFLAGLHNCTTFLLAAYCLLRELFHSRYTPLLVLAAWLAFDVIGAVSQETVDQMAGSMTRMAWTLPQEFALYLVFLCPFVLLRYFREQNKPEKWYRNANLLFLVAGVASAASTHTYVLIMAFFPCCAVLLAHWREFFKRPLAPVGAALYGLELGALPMLIAYVAGTRPENSIYWGLRVISGESGTSASLAAVPAAAAVQRNPLRELYENGYIRLFGTGGAMLMLLLSLMVIVLAVNFALGRRRESSRDAVLTAGLIKGHLILVISFTIFVFLYAMPYMGLPELVAIDRPLVITQMFTYAAAGILADLLILMVERLNHTILPRRWLALSFLFLYLFAHATSVRQCTYWSLRRYNAAVTVTNRILNSPYSDWNYRVVSMYDEGLQMGWGSHVELYDFLESTDGRDYSLPVEYIFLYVEKRPLLRGQVHFLPAPAWLAQDSHIADSVLGWSICPDILHGEISPELAREEIPYSPGMQDSFEDLAIRTALCSKAYSWYHDFSAAHPAETSVYYEDDDFVCYVIHQDASSPLNLATGRSDGR